MFTENLALNKVATQSGDFYGQTAALAVDGSYANGWDQCASTTYGDSPSEMPYRWLQVDLGQDYYIGKFALVNRHDLGRETIFNFSAWL